MPKLIEVIGSPGSGKTFLCNKLEKIRKNNKQIFFHSSNLKNSKMFNNLNFITKIYIELRVIIIVIFFCIIFHKRFFKKKIYKKNFFYLVISLFYKHIKCIESFKKLLPSESYLITEPGLIMYFLQDYFYIDGKLSKVEINRFNNLFLKVDLIIHVNCNLNLKIKRLIERKRGLPIRMRGLNSSEIKQTVKKSANIISIYLNNLKNRNISIINFQSTKKIKDQLKFQL